MTDPSNVLPDDPDRDDLRELAVQLELARKRRDELDHYIKRMEAELRDALDDEPTYDRPFSQFIGE